MTAEPYAPNEDELIVAYIRQKAGEVDRPDSVELESEVVRGIAKIKADALREAVEESEQITCEGHGGNDWFPSDWVGQVAGWLEHRANRIERKA